MKTWVTALLAAACFLMTPEVSAGDVAVIVHKENSTRDVSYQELVKLFKQDRRLWASGQRIYLLLRDRGSPEKQVVLKKIYKMDEAELKMFWLQKLYQGDISSYPKSVGSDEAVKQIIIQVPNALGMIDSAFVDDRVQVLRIDGKLPGDPGYVLSGEF